MEAAWLCWQQRDDEELFPAYYTKGMAALTQARMTLTAKNGPPATKWTLKSMVHEMNDASSKRATKDKAWKLAERIERDGQRQVQVYEILTNIANNLTYFQAAWMKRQLTGIG